MDTSHPDKPVLLPVKPLSTVVALGTPPRPPALSATPDALSLLKALRRRWAMAVALGLLLAAITGPAAWYVIPRAKYTATATLQVSMKPKRIIFEPRDSSPDFGTFQRTQVAQLRSRKILSHALDKLTSVKGKQPQLKTLQGQEDLEGWLEDQLRVEFTGGSELLNVSLSGEHPEDLQKIVNQVVFSYMELVVDEERQERHKRLDQLKKLWANYQGELKDKRGTLKKTMATVGGSDQTAVALTQQFNAENLAVARRESLRVQNEILMLQSRIATLGVRPAEPPQVASRSPAEEPQLERDPEIAQLKQRVDELDRTYRGIDRVAVRKNDPALVRAAGNLAEARKRLEDSRSRIHTESERRGGASGLPDVARMPQDPGGLKGQIAVLKTYQGALSQDIERLENELKRGKLADVVDLEEQREAMAISNEVARKVGAEVEAITVELDAPERIQVHAKATVPTRIDEMKKVKASGAAALGAFVFALVGVAFWEFLARRVDTPDELVTGLGMRLVGALPALPGRARRVGKTSALPDQRWRNVLIESVDATRTMLLHASRMEGVRVVMITSAVKGEGKTSLACHLATSLARAGRRTLLVDCDLRSPAAHRPFDLPRGPGLCDVLRGELELTDVVQETSATGLDLIAAGQCDALALQAVAQDGLRSVFKVLEGQYDFIIVDSAPVLPVADSLLIGQNVDGVLFSVMRDVSRLPQIYAAYERLSKLGAKMLGAVVSGVSSDVYQSSYYAEVHADR